MTLLRGNSGAMGCLVATEVLLKKAFKIGQEDEEWTRVSPLQYRQGKLSWKMLLQSTHDVVLSSVMRLWASSEVITELNQ